MAQRVGIIRVIVDGGAITARAEGQLSPVEWIFAIELTKSRILESSAKGSVADMISRKIDRIGGGE